VAVDRGFGGGAVAEPDGHRRQARACHQARHDKAQTAPAGQHQRGQGHAQRGCGLGEFAVGFGWVEAERLGAVQIREGKQGRALGIDQRAQAGRQGHDLRGGDHEKEKWKRKRDAGSEIVSATLGQPRGCQRKQRGHAQGGEHVIGRCTAPRVSGAPTTSTPSRAAVVKVRAALEPEPRRLRLSWRCGR
jgi:hypothetical protein